MVLQQSLLRSLATLTNSIQGFRKCIASVLRFPSPELSTAVLPKLLMHEEPPRVACKAIFADDLTFMFEVHSTYVLTAFTFAQH